jgi:hypothetical protein
VYCVTLIGKLVSNHIQQLGKANKHNAFSVSKDHLSSILEGIVETSKMLYIIVVDVC